MLKITSKISAFAFVICFSFPATAQTGYTNRYEMQKAVNGILQHVTSSSGSPLNNTLVGVAKSITTTSAAAGAGLLLASTAPTWGTVLGVAAIGGAVSYGVSVGLDSLVKWAFKSDSATPVVVTGSSSSISSNGIVQGQLCYSVDLGDICASSPQEALTTHVLTSTVFTDITAIDLVPEPVNSPAYFNGRMYYATVSGHRSDIPGIHSNMNGYYIWQVNARTTCPVNFVQNGDHCVSSMIGMYKPTSGEIYTTQVTLTDALAQLSESQRSLAMSYESMALMVNQMWKHASSQPGYSGLPYSASNPVTTSHVQQWAQSNPTLYPKVSELASPVTVTYEPSSITPAASTSGGSGGTTPPGSTTTNQSSGSIDPNSLGTLIPDTIVNRVVDVSAITPRGSGQSGTCPAPRTITVSGRTINLGFDKLCEFASMVRPLFIGFAWLAAGLSFFGFSRKDS